MLPGHLDDIVTGLCFQKLRLGRVAGGIKEVVIFRRDLYVLLFGFSDHF